MSDQHEFHGTGGPAGLAEVTDLPPGILARLRCPRCGAAVVPGGPDLICSGGHRMRRPGGYLDTCDASPGTGDSRTLDRFGYEWTAFPAIQPEDEAFWRRYVADLDLAELRGRAAIDVGCGKGRYTRFTAAHVESMIALDGSDAVQAAVANLHDMPNTLVVKAPIEAMPVADGAFDFVSCLGVLHHLPDPRAGFAKVARLLAPGGILLVYVYSRPARPGVRAAALRAAALLRRCTIRMPHRLLRAVSAPIAVFLYLAFVVPGRYGARLGVHRLAALPLAFYRGKPVRSLWLDTFDRLGAPIENRYLWPDIAPWFASAGLVVDSHREECGLFVVARRPAAGPPGDDPSGRPAGRNQGARPGPAGE